jgi:surfactin family lipopeptide synthetase A
MCNSNTFKSKRKEAHNTLQSSLATQVEKNPNALEMNQSEGILEWLDEACRIFKEQTAIEYDGKQISYSALNDITNRLANGLIANQLSKGSRVALLLDDRIEIIISIVGILKAGCVFVPLDPEFPEERLRRIVTDISPDCLIVDSKFSNLVDRLFIARDSVIIHVGDEGDFNSKFGSNITSISQLFMDFSSERPSIQIASNDMCYIYYTSGSTGVPKGIAGQIKGISHFIKWEIETFNITPGTRFSQFAMPTFDAFLKDIFVPLCVGGTICIPPDRSTIISTTLLIDWIDTNKINLIQCVPSLFEVFANGNLSSQNFSALKYILVAGESLHISVVKRWMEVYDTRIKLVNLYGATETTILKFYYEVQKSDIDRGFIPIGQPIKGARALVLDESGNVCPCGVFGELYINTPYRTLGYYNKPELTKEVFLKNPFSKDPSNVIFKTGDLARVLSDGNYQFGGRKDNQVKIRGIRVELDEIENQLRSHNLIKSAVVLSREDEFDEKRLVAYVVADQQTAISVNDLRHFLQRQLPAYMVPSAFVILKILPLTPNGKVDRKALPAPDGDIERELEYVAPRTPSEEIIAHIFAEVLGIETVGIQDNFFEQGGHSLLATQLISRLRQSFEAEIPIKAIFELPTVAQLNQKISQLRVAGQGLSLPPIERIAPGTQEIPLSFAQERLWFFNQLEGASATYNMPAALCLSGALNLKALQQALAEIVRRHDILRTSFANTNGIPIQVIHPTAIMDMEIVNLQHLEERARELALEQQIQQLTISLFDLESIPLIRCSLWQLSDSDYIFGINMHHIVSDRWSIDLMVRELSLLYKAFCNGESSPLVELPIQYADFAHWQRQWLQGEALQVQMDYWKAQMDGAPPLLELPTDYPRPAIQSFQASRLDFSLPAVLTEQLQKLSRQHEVTLFMTLLGAYAVLLSRYSGQQDIVIGSPIANRNRVETESLIGFFVNTLAFRVDLSGNPSFEQLLERVRQVALGAYEHQDLPFEKLVEELQPERSLSHNPIFQVSLTLQNTPVETLELSDLKLEPFGSDISFAPFDLTLLLQETADGLAGSWKYKSNLFDRETIERLNTHFQILLEGIALI